MLLRITEPWRVKEIVALISAGVNISPDDLAHRYSRSFQRDRRALRTLIECDVPVVGKIRGKLAIDSVMFDYQHRRNMGLIWSSAQSILLDRFIPRVLCNVVSEYLSCCLGDTPKAGQTRRDILSNFLYGKKMEDLLLAWLPVCLSDPQCKLCIRFSVCCRSTANQN